MSDSPPPDNLNPWVVLTNAVRELPFLKYAIGVVAVVACVTIVAGFNVGPLYGFVGAVPVLIFMVVLVALGKAMRSPSLRHAAIVVVYSSVALFVAAATVLFTAFAFDVPKAVAVTLMPCPDVRPHSYNENGKCTRCQNVCTHRWVNGECAQCGVKCNPHQWEAGVCTRCDYHCTHSYTNTRCTHCGTFCAHPNWVDGACTQCDMQCRHRWEGGACTVCGSRCAHSWDEAQRCRDCGVDRPLLEVIDEMRRLEDRWRAIDLLDRLRQQYLDRQELQDAANGIVIALLQGLQASEDIQGCLRRLDQTEIARRAMDRIDWTATVTIDGPTNPGGALHTAGGGHDTEWPGRPAGTHRVEMTLWISTPEDAEAVRTDIPERNTGPLFYEEFQRREYMMNVVGRIRERTITVHAAWGGNPDNPHPGELPIPVAFDGYDAGSMTAQGMTVGCRFSATFNVRVTWNGCRLRE